MLLGNPQSDIGAAGHQGRRRMRPVERCQLITAARREIAGSVGGFIGERLQLRNRLSGTNVELIRQAIFQRDFRRR